MIIAPRGMKVVIRADASKTIGSGHVMRCASLAEALRETDAEVRFVCRDLPGNYAEWLRSRGFTTILLPASAASRQPGSDQYGCGLGVDLATEIEQCRAALSDIELDWLIVDHYALDAVWEQAVCPHSACVLAIDDLANRTHSCAMLLDQNYHATGIARYAGLASSADLMLGPNFALLRPDFIASRFELRPRTGELRKLLIFFGGSDYADVSSKLLRTLAKRGGSEFLVEVIAGQSNPNLGVLQALCKRVGANLYKQVDDMAARMAAADLAIGATGTSTWERAALGLPTLAVSVAENQREVARHAEALGVLRWLGDEDAVSEDDWSEAIDWALDNPMALREQSRTGMKTVDGQGVGRVVQRMYEHQCRLR